jgi:hypothetical protein
MNCAQCLGHAWSGDQGNEPVQRLQYVEARIKIYIPAFQWVLDNVPNVQAALRKVAEAALKVGYVPTLITHLTVPAISC